VVQLVDKEERYKEVVDQHGTPADDEESQDDDEHLDHLTGDKKGDIYGLTVK